jgi:hypothetical protein
VNRFTCQIAFALAIAFAVGAVSQADEPRHLKDAVKLVRAIDVQHTEYRHQDPLVRWPNANGGQIAECRTDCSGFMNALIEHTYHVGSADLAAWLGRERPRATEYFKAVEAKNHFRPLSNIREIVAGDIIVIRYLPNDPENTAHNTGHVLLAAEPAAPLGNTPHGTSWQIKVIDESHSGHGPQDTRHQPGGKFYPGLGTGALQLVTDAQGHITGYAWSTAAKSEFHSVQTRPIAVGRLELE